jgi:hypothetical protein
MRPTLPFRQVWTGDFEFEALPGERPDPVCLVARELGSQTTVRLWRDELRSRRRPPFPTRPDSLFIAYFASAEIDCFLELGWPVPERILDLHPEFRRHTNVPKGPTKPPLLSALAAFGIPCLSSAEKSGMRDLVMRGRPWSDSERRDILAYCESDVIALEPLLYAMLPGIDLPRALLRGRYVAAVSRMQRTGIPVDAELLARLMANWSTIRERLIVEVDRNYGIYEGETFKRNRFVKWLSAHNIPWPMLRDDVPDLKSDTFRLMSKAFPAVAPLQELRASLSELRLSDIKVDHGGRHRTLLSPFGTSTGRNAPSSTRFIFGPAVWMRGLIRPTTGRALAYVDWSQQEFGIAAALSGDSNMIAAYHSGDAYLAFAKRAGGVPPGATKETHGPQRELYKICVLATQYLMGEASLAASIGQLPIVARHLLRDHREVFPVFWRWADSVAANFSLRRELQTMFGWRLRNNGDGHERTGRNFPMQSTGAEIMRLAACSMTEAGVQVCCPIHDAFLIEAADADIVDVVQAVQAHMVAASRVVLAGFELRSDAKVIRYPDRYADPRGVRTWELVLKLLNDIHKGGYLMDNHLPRAHQNARGN